MGTVRLYDLKGELSGLVRKVGKSGSESWSFNVTGTDLQEWERLKLLHREKVIMTIEGAQAELPGIGGEDEPDEAGNGHDAGDEQEQPERETAAEEPPPPAENTRASRRAARANA